MIRSPEQIDQVFWSALQLSSEEERNAYLSRACGDDHELRRLVEKLLRAQPKAAAFLEQPLAEPRATVDEPISEAPGTVIGPYKLLEQIGEGGFGVVFMAEQTEPVRRKVALKILKPGMDTRQVVARFEAERQALAIMDHPNIAKVFDGGVTGDRSAGGSPASQHTGEPPALRNGRPYFVMELVRGVPITDFCDHNQLTPRQRLELFMAVCQAIQHAHQKGIIHRDLKPSNILVVMHDTTPVPKVIDFGIAKALGQELTDKTLFTGFAQMVGTPLYMSPEQAGQSGLDIDTRSDIYSLGVLLYELLTGTTPFDKERFKKAAYDEIRRIIREEEPPKPSTRLSESKDSLASISAQRHTEPAKLTKLMRGELDWIVMKALEKDRNRRYETANGFAMDVQRYLADEPVLACPPSVGYRLRKFARRNKAALAVAALVLFFLVLLGSGVGWAVRDRAAREAEAARQQADRQAKVAGQVESILAEVDRLEGEQKWPEALAAARRAEAAVAGGEADAATGQRVRELLKDLEFIDRLEQIRMQSATTVEGKFDNAGAVREYARAFRGYGVDVEELAVEASIERLKARPGVSIPLAAALDNWVFNRRRISAEDVAGWKRLVAVARGIDPEPLRDRLRATWGRPHSEMRDELRRLAESIDIRAQHPATLLSLARTLQRVKLSDSALPILRDAQYFSPGDFWLNFDLGYALREKDDEGAIRFYTAAVAIRPHSAAARNNLGDTLRHHKKLDEAIAMCRKAIELDPKLAPAFSTLGQALREQNKLDQAIEACHKAIEIDPKHAHAYFGLGLVWMEDQKNKLDKAEAYLRTAINLDSKFADAHNMLGKALSLQNKLDDAIASYHRAIAIDPNANAYYGLGYALKSQGKDDGAIEAYRQATIVDPKFAIAYHGLGNALVRKGKIDDAIAAFDKAIELEPKNAGFHNALGDALMRQKKVDEAIAAFRSAVKAEARSALAHYNLGIALRDRGQLEEAIAAFRKAIKLDPKGADAHSSLGDALMRKGKLDDAIDALRKAIKLDPKNADAHNNVARACAILGRWDQAAAHTGKLIELQPSDDISWMTHACFLLRAGDKEGYRRACKQMLERFGQTKNWAVTHRVAWTCLLIPDAVSDQKLLVELAKQGVAGAPDQPWCGITLGAAFCRAGQFEQAIKQLRPYADRKDHEVVASLLLAIAHYRLHQGNEARQCLDKAMKRMDNELAAKEVGPLRQPGWAHNWAACEVLRREAEELLKK